jgi:F-type H+-transporting ATPase subunit b
MMLLPVEVSKLVLANGGESAEFGIGLLVMTIITFLVLFGILSKFAIGPTMVVLKRREEQIKEAIDSAKRERSEAEKLLADQKVAISQARQEAMEQVRKTQADMEKFRDELMGKARKEAEDLKIESRQLIEGERAKAVVELKAEAVKLSILVAEKLLNEKLDDGRQQALAQQFVSDLSKKPTA